MTSSARTRLSGNLIDVHAHYALAPDAGQREAAEARFRAGNFLAPPASSWSPEQAIEFMDGHGIRLQLLSNPAGVDAEEAQRVNDLGAEIVAGHPDRFGLLAGLPMGEPDRAIAEIGRAIDELHADGFVIVTNYRGAYLGDPSFDPVFAELDRRGATVFLHPAEPAGYPAVACGRPGPVFEFPVDTARTVTDAIYARVFQRYPNFRLVLAHAGGVLPSLAGRLASVGTLPWVPNTSGVTGADVTSQLAGLYYDTAIAATPHSLLPLLQTTTGDHVLFGSDYPPAGVATIEANLAALDATPALTDTELAALPDTALRLFPSLRNRI